jgi:hypothetical protein
MMLGGDMLNACKIYDYLKFCFWYDLQKNRTVKEKTKENCFKNFDLQVNQKIKTMRMYG